MDNTKTYVFDTSYLIEYPEALNNITGALVIPAVVLKQLDGLKNSKEADTAKLARAAADAILEAQRENRLRIVGEFRTVDMLASYADNVIVGTALKIKETNPEVVLMTTDINMKNAAENAGILYEKSKLQKRSSSLIPLFSVIISLIVSAWFIGRALSYGSAYDPSRISDAVMVSGFLSLLIIIPSAFVSAWRRGDFNSTRYEPEWKSIEEANPVIYDPIFSDTKGNIYHVDRDRR
ncbi:MAG: PIN domain-containing protein [Syntrophales bacterium]|jgi:rRNA-processing protein FCF1